MSEDRALARPLKVLTPLLDELIKEYHEAVENVALETRRAAGAILNEAKVHHRTVRDWDTYVRRRGLSPSTADRWMALDTVASQRSPGPGRQLFKKGETLEGVTGESRTPRIAEPIYYQPVQKVLNSVNTEALAGEVESVRKERELVRDLGMQLIKIGFRVLAAKLHPDKGGSSEAMARLNKVKSILEEAL